MFQRKKLSLFLSALLTAAVALPAAAAVEQGTSSFEIFAGVNFSDIDLVDEDATYGVRFGHVFTPRVGLEIGANYFDGNYDDSLLGIDIEDWYLDLGVIFFANPDSRAVFNVYGGIGWATEDATFTDKVGVTVAEFDDDSFTVHAGIGGRFYLGEAERVYLRLDGKARWYENTDDDRIDFEALFGVGWVFGGR